MRWEDFREEYRRIQLPTIRDRSSECAENRLDIAERILNPRTLGDVANPEALHKLQTELLAGAHSRFNRRRSPHTVKSYMAAVLSALGWAETQGWIPSTPKIRKVKTHKLRQMKGRPITTEEFERMLDKTKEVVGDEAAESWKYLLRGLWESALRLDELMHLSWNEPNTIRPEWKRGRLPVLIIPHQLQKNDTEEAIPLLPWFESVLLVTVASERTGWVFDPVSLQTKVNRRIVQSRPNSAWVAKVVSRIGKAENVVVIPGDGKTGRPTKYASAHDLRRSCADRLLDAGVPPITIARVLRHASWDTTRRHYAPGDVQKDAGVLRKLLGKPVTDERLRAWHDPPSDGLDPASACQDVPRYISDGESS